MAKPMSWKWKLGLGIAGFIAFCFAATFSPWGVNYMKSSIDNSFNEMSPAERRDAPQAKRFIFLAWWRGSVLQDAKGGMDMYVEFLGMGKGPDKKDIFDNMEEGNPKFPDTRKVSEDGLTGWGPMHPDAADVFMEYLLHCESEYTGGKTGGEALKYYKLLYTWMAENSPDRKPHPKFRKHWDKVKDLLLKNPEFFRQVDPQATNAPLLEGSDAPSAPAPVPAQ